MEKLLLGYIYINDIFNDHIYPQVLLHKVFFSPLFVTRFLKPNPAGDFFLVFF